MAPVGVDLLVVLDNSGSMRSPQTQMVQQIDVLVRAIVNPPDEDGDGAPDAPAVHSLRLGVVTTDLGTPGSVVPSCANSDGGDDGLLNPVAHGLATRAHLPWTVAPPGVRAPRCTNDQRQYPRFLTHDAARAAPEDTRADYSCIAWLGGAGCGIEQQLEAAYRALVVHDARGLRGGANAGFVRDEALLGVLFFTDEEDTSVRDCRYAEPGDPDGDCGPGRGDATGVFDSADGAWAATDLNLRSYLYVPGSRQDPTWNLRRYLDPAAPTRGLLGLKPGHPERVLVAGLLGVPLAIPRRSGGEAVDWSALLGDNPDGSDGFTGMSPEGPVSMRQRNPDPDCGMRVVPACHAEGTPYNPERPTCDATERYFAWPSLRLATLVRRADEGWGNGVLGSICANDYGPFLRAFARRLRARYR